MKPYAFAAFALGLSLVSGIAAAETPPTRTRGTIEQVTDQSVAVKTRDGKTISIKLTADTKVLGATHAEIGDIKPNSYIGSAAVPQPDGSLKALEVSVFDPALRGVGDGHYAWDLGKNSTMTNGAVGDLVVSSGRTMTVKYNGGEKKITVPDDVPIVAVAPGDRSLLKAGVRVVVIAPKAEDGSLTAAVVVAGQNGVVPPL